jgi:hypothetical protein
VQEISDKEINSIFIYFLGSLAELQTQLIISKDWDTLINDLVVDNV